MIFHKIKRKIYKALHPAIGEVWMLHSICSEGNPELNNPAIEISSSRLEINICEKLSKGYKFISLNELFDIYQGKRLHTKFVCITLDDGYENNFTVAYPIFQKYNCPFAISITTGFCNNSVKPWWGDNIKFLSFQQIQYLSNDPLCTISAHTVTHPRLNRLTYDEKKKEITDSINTLKELINKDIVHFAYPHGEFDKETIDILRLNSIHTCVKVNGGYVRRKQDSLEIPRIIIH